MIDESLISNIPIMDPRYSQAYINAMNAMGPIEGNYYNIQYHNSVIDDDNVNDSIKVKILYNELMKLKTEFDNSTRRLMSEINCLNSDNRRLVEENKRLSDEIASIKQAFYFG